MKTRSLGRIKKYLTNIMKKYSDLVMTNELSKLSMKTVSTHTVPPVRLLKTKVLTGHGIAVPFSLYIIKFPFYRPWFHVTLTPLWPEYNTETCLGKYFNGDVPYVLLHLFMVLIIDIQRPFTPINSGYSTSRWPTVLKYLCVQHWCLV